MERREPPTVLECWAWLERIDGQLAVEKDARWRRSLYSKRHFFEAQLVDAQQREGYPQI